ncbi:MAG: exodeoxyribonuclease VII large subunit [Hoeflea sp.]|uniref:exodeoxyribonuclease VII large subunit n=1 Tax=Hoeflea sp. TaxID=1940281 RepID=UPI001D9A4809|nr:exodeoxyribonuclease VII large subunit [Alphaproteobacteria bacterium]MBV1724957.1 exodeoxyribonuclease VII large subunit [Hoeflea sp.]MBU4544537.1 exodeoxyribonuclease VII large subunit [Alphaproteobacteria bacterium]MBU4552768.1 exodeoxyribonuclease VII large subunit [Alphaproteobacteria bacterium]MBV1760977.1 exodeoxyribonuclease VII large subunit [Hoeflea sp.]
MSDLLDDSPSNATEFTVSELSGSIRRTVEDAFGYVRVRGEISGYRGPHSSGHAYFSLKDDKARIEAVIWKGVFSRLTHRPEEGLEVIATGKITTYPGSSKYQIVIEAIEPAGAGALMALIEERRRRLAAEGLFDEARKQLLPFMPGVIGVVTSPTGAVIRDILHRLEDRFPVHVIVWPVRVQGETSGQEVAQAITGFNALAPGGPIARPELIIVARGGGSLEDLWGFNDEAVVRAAAGSDIPLISAVGHETDWTLIDHAADRRAPTPTGAAEMAVPVKADLVAEVASLAARLRSAQSRTLDRRREAVRGLARALPTLDSVLALPRQRLDRSGQGLGQALQLNTANRRRHFERQASRVTPVALVSALRDKRQMVRDRAARADRAQERRLDAWRSRLDRHAAVLSAVPRRIADLQSRGRDRLKGLHHRADIALTQLLGQRRRGLGAQSRMLQSLSYHSVLGRGFAVIRDSDRAVLSRATQVNAGTLLAIEFADGEIAALAQSSDQPPSAPKKPPRPKRREPGQGSLF